jgi:copper resistance protein B
MNKMRLKYLNKLIGLVLPGFILFSPLVLSQEKSNRVFDPLERSWLSGEYSTHNWPEPVVDSQNLLFLQADRLEAGFHEGNETYSWDIQGWYGEDYNKLWMKSEAEGRFGESLEDFEIQALYSRLISPFWDIQIGGRYDINPDPERAHLVVGLQGLAPYWLEIDSATFLSDKGDLTFRAELEYELLLTQRFIIQPRIEINASAQDIPELQIGSGINNTEIGLRFRYEIKREFAPYIGISWKRHYGSTADYLRAGNEKTSDFAFVVGLRLWY